MPSPASRTFSPRARDLTRDWYVVDADGQVLGRLAAQVARILRGKHKPIFAPHVDTGDHVIIINAAKVRLTGRKREQKVAYRHSGYPGGLKSRTFADAQTPPPRLLPPPPNDLRPGPQLRRRPRQRERLEAELGDAPGEISQAPCGAGASGINCKSNDH